MKTTFISLLLLCLFSISYAQNRANIKGRVIDSISKQPLELSTIAVVDVKDTSLIAYTLTKKTGDFELLRLPADKPVRLVISFAGYKSYIRRFTFNKGDVIDLGSIALNSKMLNEVVVRAERVPIKMKKDTIEFDAAAFKTRPNAAVEELLKKLPGVQIDGDGSITVNGKQVSKLLIDGKQFFGSDPKIATKNLDAAIVAQVQVYDDRENDPNHLVSETQVPKIINIKLKKAIKKSMFGKVFAGGGTRDRYEIGGLFNMFRDTLQLSLIGLSNNLNHTAFSRDELSSQGGFDRSGGNTSFNGGRSGGIEKITSGGFNLNQNYGERLKLNLQYFYTQRNNINQSENSQQLLITKDTTLTTKASNQRWTNNYSHAVSGLVEWKPDTIRNLRYNPSVNFNSSSNKSIASGKTANNFDMPVNESASNSFGNGRSTSFNQSFYFHKRSRNKAKETFTISHSLSISPNRNANFNNNDVINYQRPQLSDSLHRYATRTSNNASGNVDISYRYPVTKKLIVDITASGIYNKTSDLVYTFDRKTGGFDSLLSNQSSNLKRDQRTENVKPGITYQLNKKVQIIAGLNTQWQQINNNFVTSHLLQNYFFLLPTIRIEAYGLSFSYDRRVNQPGVSSLQPITIVYSSLYSFTGNPNLVPAVNNSYNFNFFKYWNNSQLGIYSNGSVNSQKNMVLTQQIARSDGSQNNTVVNRDGRPSYNFSIGVFKRFKKVDEWQLYASTSGFGNYYQSLNLINNGEGWQNTLSYGMRENVGVNWKDVIDFNTGAGFNQSNTKYNYGDFNNIKVGTLGINNNLVVRFPKKLIWETKQDFNYNSQVAPGFKRGVNVVSSSLALQMLKKDRGELKLTVYDIFNQNVSVYRYVNTNMVNDVQNNTLKRYFLVTYSIKFNKFN